MGCYYHNDREVDGKCKTCGKELCHECFELTNGRSCYACADNAQRVTKKNVVKCAVLFSITAVILAFLAVVFVTNLGEEDIVKYIAIGVGIVGLFIPGWIYAGIPLNLVYPTSSKPAKYYFIRFILAVLCAALSIVIYLIALISSSVRYNKAKKDVMVLNSHEQSLPNPVPAVSTYNVLTADDLQEEDK